MQNITKTFAESNITLVFIQTCVILSALIWDSVGKGILVLSGGAWVSVFILYYDKIYNFTTENRVVYTTIQNYKFEEMPSMSTWHNRFVYK